MFFDKLFNLENFIRIPVIEYSPIKLINDVNWGAFIAKAKVLKSSPAPDNLASKSNKFDGKKPL